MTAREIVPLAIILGTFVALVWWLSVGASAHHRKWDGATIARYCGAGPVYHLKDGSYVTGTGIPIEDIEKVCK